jgi:hypothetical protein
MTLFKNLKQCLAGSLLLGTLITTGCMTSQGTSDSIRSIDFGLRPRGVRGQGDCGSEVCPRCNCPDDYCPKPMPCVACGHATVGCDDYCAKPAPCPPADRDTVWCDDYCEKEWLAQPCQPLPGASCSRGTASP